MSIATRRTVRLPGGVRLRAPGRAAAGAVAGGVVLAAASPPFDLVPAVFAGMAILAILAVRAGSASAAFAHGTLLGTVAGLIGMRFIPVVLDRFAEWGAPVGVAATVAVAVAQALAWGACAAITNVLVRRGRLPLEIGFGAGTFVALHAPSLFGWSPAALVLPRPELLQLAEIVGERGVSVVVAMIAALLARAATADRHGGRWLSRAVPLVAALLALVVVDRAGAARMDAVAAREGERLRVALVDHDAAARVDPSPRRRAAELARLHELSARGDAQGAELVVWPEGAHPFTLDRPLTAVPPAESSPVTLGARAPRLIGVKTVEERPTPSGALKPVRFNSATLVAPSGAITQPYDKVELLWFGERMPLGDQLPFLRDLLPRGSRLEPGAAPRPLVLDRVVGGRNVPLRLGILTCYEDMLTAYGRRTGRAVRPQLLVDVSNNSWFARTVATDWQERLSRMRAIELRSDLVRAVNRGVTGWVDASGRMRLRHESVGPSVQIAVPRLRPADAAQTLYVRLGDWPLRALLVLLALAAVARARRGAGRAT